MLTGGISPCSLKYQEKPTRMFHVSAPKTLTCCNFSAAVCPLGAWERGLALSHSVT